MLKKVLLVVAAVLVLFLVVVALQPSKYHVERSATMAAPAQAVFDQVNDFHKWEAWSPWVALDPAAKFTYEGPASGVGATFAWDGNDEMGTGKMTILESRAPEAIKIKLTFVEPFESECTVDFAFRAEGDKTNVTWSMDGEHIFIGKAMCLFMDMDTMVGADYEKGLAGIRAIVEAPAK